jgi:uncharacterized protein (DUF1697 family)
MKQLTTYVALLRGINVGGNNKISMLELKRLMEDAGYQNVRTYINSGNVVFRTQATDPRKLETAIEAVISKGFTLPISVVVRNLAEMERVIRAIPKSWKDQATYRCYALFLRHTIDTPDVLEKIGTIKPEIEELVYAPGVVFWTLRLDSVTKSGLRLLITGPLYKALTMRNQNTTRKIYAMMQEADAGAA